MPSYRDSAQTILEFGSGDIAIMTAQVPGTSHPTEIIFVEADSGHKPNEIINEEYFQENFVGKTTDDLGQLVRFSFGCVESIDSLITVLMNLRGFYE